jgi:hypothetical protein
MNDVTQAERLTVLRLAELAEAMTEEDLKAWLLRIEAKPDQLQRLDRAVLDDLRPTQAEWRRLSQGISLALGSPDV